MSIKLPSGSILLGHRYDFWISNFKKGDIYMRKAARKFGIVLFVITSWVSVPQFICAEIDLTLIKQTNLDVQPLDVATSADGKMIYLLARGEILVYSIDEDKVSNRIPIDKDFDKMTYAATNNSLILTSSSSKTLKIIQVDFIYNIALDGLPFKGPADAAVTIAVFDDYQ